MKKLFALMASLLLCSTVYAGTIDLGTDFATGTVISSSTMNTKLQTIETVINGNIDGNNIAATSNVTVANFANTGTTDIGNGATDTVSVTGRFDSDLLPILDATSDLGSSALSWHEGHFNTVDADDTLTLNAVSVNQILDEDAMGSDSDTSLATQQSIKAYVATVSSGQTFGLFQHDISSTTATAVTDVGFQPTAGTFFGVISGKSSMFIGADDGTNDGVINTTSNDGSDSATWGNDNTSPIRGYVNSSDYIEGEVTFDAAGFDVAWTKTGSPTGTLTVYYLVIK